MSASGALATTGRARPLRTRLRAVPGIVVRRARSGDVPAMAEMIQELAAQGRMLPRSADELRASLSAFRVAVTEEGRIVATGGLRLYGPESAEIIGLAVAASSRGTGLGRRMVEELVKDARRAGRERVFALTLEPGFFASVGFGEIAFDVIPEKVARDCVACPFRAGCVEIPVMRRLAPSRKQGERRTPSRTLSVVR